jgi:transcriptional regulator with XRE-family HTH domain
MERVRELRTRRGLSQTALAARAGWGRSRVCDLEAGRVTNPSLTTLQRIADALDVEVYDLLVRPANERREPATLAS